MQLFNPDFKLVREIGGARHVHARGCKILATYETEGVEEIPRFKPEKHVVCKTCEKLIYIANAAEDYVENFLKYERWLASCVSLKILKELLIDRGATLRIEGNRVYVKVGRERFYVDFTLFDVAQVRLFHNNYKLNARKENEDDYASWAKDKYHEHDLRIHSASNAFQYIAWYHYKDAEKNNHGRKEKPKFSELDPEFYGFK